MRYFEMLIAIDGSWARYMVIPANGNRQALRRAAVVMRAEYDDKPLKLVEMSQVDDVPSLLQIEEMARKRNGRRR